MQIKIFTGSNESGSIRSTCTVIILCLYNSEQIFDHCQYFCNNIPVNILPHTHTHVHVHAHTHVHAECN